MLAWIQTKAIALIAAAIPVGIIASVVYQGIKRLIEKETLLLAKTPAAVHRIYFSVVAVVLTAIAGALGITIECPPEVSCLTVLTQDQLATGLQAALTIVVGLATHALKKAAAK
jgi:hypothetical protein